MAAAENKDLLSIECRKITAEEQQQEFCSYLGFQSETIIWDEYVFPLFFLVRIKR